jgi:quercetin dioxygenase-like cupin family protein
MELEEATAGPVIMRTATMKRDETLELVPSADHEHLLLVLTGRVEIAPGKAPGARLDPWHAMRARGVPVAVTALEDAKLVKVLVHGEPLPKRDVEVLNLTTADELTWADGRAHARLAFEDGRASFGLLYSAPNLGVPRHSHAASVEVVGLLRGEGTMGVGDDDRGVAAGEVFHIPAGTPHDYRPSGKAGMFAVQLYLPPGPEQRFKSLAKKAE